MVFPNWAVFLSIKTSQAILLTAGAVVLYNAINKGHALGTLNWFPSGVQDISFDGATPVMKLALMAQNTSGQQMVLNSFAGNLYANDILIGNLSSFSPQVIPPNNQRVLIFNVRLSLLGIVNDIINAFQSHSTVQSFVLEAHANVDNFQIPVDLNYKVGG